MDRHSARDADVFARRGRGKNCIRVARQRVEKGLQYAFRDRRRKKREMRSLWIQRINAGAKEHGVRFHPSLSSTHLHLQHKHLALR